MRACIPFQTPTREIPKSEANLPPLSVLPACSRRTIRSFAFVDNLDEFFLLTNMSIRLTKNENIVNRGTGIIALISIKSYS